MAEATEKSLRDTATEELRTFCEITEQIQIVDLPDCRSPMTSSRCPFATGKSTSTTRIPVTTDGVLRERTKIDGLEESTIASLEIIWDRNYFIINLAELGKEEKI